MSHLGLHKTPDDDNFTRTLGRSVDLANLATILFIILRPDEAAELARNDENAQDGDFDPEPRTRRSMAVDRLDFMMAVRRRNAALLKAWKAFWLVLVSADKRSNEDAISLWLELSTQVSH